MIAASTPVTPIERCPDRPRLVPGCSFHRYDNGRDNSEFVLCVPDGKQYRVPALAKEILTRLDGSTNLSWIVADLNQRSISITLEQLRTLLDQRYCGIGVIDPCTPWVPEGGSSQKPPRIGFPLLFGWQLIAARRVARLAALLRHAYDVRVLFPLWLMIVIAHVAVYSPSRVSALPGPESYTALVALCIVSIVVHELGHAAAVARLGGSPGAIGCGLYLLIPTFWADVSQLWRFPRRGRMVVDLGGIYFQELAFTLFAGIGLVTARPEFFAACRLVDVMALMSLNPIFRFDGYWFLVDYLAMPRLYRVALLAPFQGIARLFRSDEATSILPGRPVFARAVFWSYSMLSSGFLLVALWISYRYLTVTVLSLPHMLLLSMQRARGAAESGDLLMLANYILAAIFLIAISSTALIGVCLYTVRGARFVMAIARRLAQRSIRLTSVQGETR